MAKQVGIKKPAPSAPPIPKPKIGITKGQPPAPKACPDCGKSFSGASCPFC